LNQLHSRPSQIQFETNTNCNGKCTFCQYPNMKRQGRASWSQILQILYDYAPQVNEIVPFGMQEPLLEPRLTAILTSAKQFNRKAKTILFSNMTVYNPETWTKIIKHQSLDELNISFYGTTKRVYNKLQPGFDFYQVQKNIKSLVRLRKRLRWNKPQINMRLIVMPETVGAHKFTAKWRKTVDQVGVGFYDAWCGLTSNYNPEWEQKIWGPPAERRDPCPRLWGTLVIRSDGTVVPCCLDHECSMPLGNVHVEKDIFNNRKFQDIRRLHVEGRQDEIPLCKDCSLWRYEHPKEWTDYWKNTVISVRIPYMK